MKLSVFALSFLLTGMASLSAQAEGLEARQTVEKIVAVTQADGSVEITYVPADRAAPGDELVHAVVYTNNAANAAEGVVLSMPIEASMVYLEGSALTPTADVTFSVDGRNFVSRSELVVNENGTPRPASAADVRAVRWALKAPIAAGATGKVSLRTALK
jgi:hypothetical protein